MGLVLNLRKNLTLWVRFLSQLHQCKFRVTSQKSLKHFWKWDLASLITYVLLKILPDVFISSYHMLAWLQCFLLRLTNPTNKPVLLLWQEWGRVMCILHAEFPVVSTSQGKSYATPINWILHRFQPLLFHRLSTLVVHSELHLFWKLKWSVSFATSCLALGTLPSIPPKAFSGGQDGPSLPHPFSGV